jgi:hypothetical protein
MPRKRARWKLCRTLAELGIDDREGLAPREKAAKALDLRSYSNA